MKIYQTYTQWKDEEDVFIDLPNRKYVTFISSEGKIVHGALQKEDKLLHESSDFIRISK